MKLYVGITWEVYNCVAGKQGIAVPNLGKGTGTRNLNDEISTCNDGLQQYNDSSLCVYMWVVPRMSNQKMSNSRIFNRKMSIPRMSNTLFN